MNKIEWENDYSINVAVIDEEHKQFISIINKAIAAIHNNNDGEKISEALNAMTLYAVSHFKNEEKYMITFDYQEYILHKREHKNFLKKTIDFCKNVTHGNNNISGSLHKYLKKWLEEHIQVADKKLTECFNKNGLS